MDKVFLNTDLIERDAAHVDVSDTGLLYGAGLFETLRVCRGRIFAAPDHIERLLASARTLEIRHEFTADFLLQSMHRTVRANELLEARLRLTLTNGTLNPEGTPTPTLLITAIPLVPYPKEYYEKGITVTLTEHRQNPQDPLAGHKTTSYYGRLLVLHQAYQKRCAEALWFTPENRLAEGSITNVFLVKKGELFTPPLDTPVLPGVMRKHVLSIAAQNGITCREQILTLHDMMEADEMFLTNVIMGVMPVSAFEAHTVAEGKVGDLTKRLMQWTRDLLEKESQ